ncbi:ATP-binding cassette domain-containing protein [Pseudotamlana carrageenivorans]|uniref:ABC transporter n=1 Tax=Pseudotamlana carrageenivorans TaxID=2069432 RepID=A0A2I7SL14_9FLAO|nr:ATP-binding cassette domain-containing protein [Tamlana carrageenivorans]AUS06582.1 ABC transporter [Tamlana carrageenivorans]
MFKNHVALYISNNEDKKRIVESIQTGTLFENLVGLKTLLFSELTLDKFIKEELQYDQFNIETIHKNKLSQASGGERKKALLKYLISQNPECLIVDNVFDSLDSASQKAIALQLETLSDNTIIIQVLTRKHQLLPFILNLYQFHNNTFKKVERLETQVSYKFLLDKLPQPEHEFDTDFKSLVKFNKVSIQYGERPIVRNITWEIKPGDFWQLIGPNGAGKSTLITLITGDNPKAYGQDLVLFGRQKGSGESVWDIKNNIGHYSAEILRGFRRLDSVEKMMLSGFYDSIGLYKFPTERQKFIAHDWLKMLGLFELRDKDFLSLSVGHQRLVLIARAMVKHPPLLILDEPTNGLDDADAVIFSELVNKIASESKTAILYVSHQKEASILRPDFIYELTPSTLGSQGKVVHV